MVLTLFIAALIIGIILLTVKGVSKELHSVNGKSETDVDNLLKKREIADQLNKDVDESVEKVKQKISKIENKKQSNEN